MEQERQLEKDLPDYLPLLEIFWEFHFTRDCSTHGVEPLKPERIRAHLDLSGEELSPWRYKALMQLDRAYRATHLDLLGDK